MRDKDDGLNQVQKGRKIILYRDCKLDKLLSSVGIVPESWLV